MTDTDVPSFTEAWELAEPIPGWLTADQARMLWDNAVECPADGHIVEIGSHQGRSTVVLASSARRQGATVDAIDPFVEGRLFGGNRTRVKFEANVAAAGVQDRVTLWPKRSTELRPTWSTPIDMLYIDGKHDYWTVADDFHWAEHLRPGGVVLVHDCFSSIGVTLAVLAHVLPGKNLNYECRAGSMAQFRVIPNDAGSRLRMMAQLPWWVRNVGIKVLLRARLYRVAEAVGHTGQHDPY